MSKQTVHEQEQIIDAWIRANNQGASFDGRVAHVEQLCRRTLSAAKTSDLERPLKYESRLWYAREIVREIANVRSALACGDSEQAASHAVVVGALAADANARHNWPAVQLGIKSIQTAELGGRRRGKAIAEDARQLTERIRQSIVRHRASDERLTIRALARRFNASTRTIQRHLKALGLTLQK